MKEYQPPYTLNSAILKRVAAICEMLGELSVSQRNQDLRLRRINRIRTIQGSLAIEGNTLTEDQISTILDGRHLVAPLREVQEVRNAVTVYDQCAGWAPLKERDLLNAHKLLMLGLVDSPGTYRERGTGVMGAKKMVHIAPPAAGVPHLMKDLFNWLKSTDEHPLVAAAVFHYEFEFIHPFEDGNGRMGRLWQMLILRDWNTIFASIPVESMVYANQQGYYKAINVSGGDDGCAPFIEFMLGVIYKTLSMDNSRGGLIGELKGRLIDLTSRQAEILGIISADRKISIKAIAEILNINRSAVDKHLSSLKKKGFLKRVGGTRGHWEVFEG